MILKSIPMKFRVVGYTITNYWIQKFGWLVTLIAVYINRTNTIQTGKLSYLIIFKLITSICFEMIILSSNQLPI